MCPVFNLLYYLLKTNEMIPLGPNNVICSKCGLKFIIDKTSDVIYSPESCPDCSSMIIELIVPIDGSRIIAIVDDTEE